MRYTIKRLLPHSGDYAIYDKKNNEFSCKLDEWSQNYEDLLLKLHLLNQKP